MKVTAYGSLKFIRSLKLRLSNKVARCLASCSLISTKTTYITLLSRITPDDYTENKLRYDQEISRIKQQIERLEEADKSFYVTATYLLHLFKHDEKIFEVASHDEKRELLKRVLSNLELKGKTVRFTPNEPFATVLKLSERSTWQEHEEY